MFIFEENNASSYLDVESEDLMVQNLLNKYNITTQNSFLYNLYDDYKALIDYISDLYIQNKPIPEDICQELISNLNFKSYLLLFVKEKMLNILSNSTTIIFKEMVTIVNLLSFGKKFQIFESYNFYNLEQLGLLFRDFEEKLKALKEKNEKDFLITFNQYTILIEIVNELCIINSTDVLRKKTINPLVNTISETINIVKFNIQLDDVQINTLNNILGKLLFYYSHIPYIDASNKNTQYLIDEFKFNFEKICDGYHLSKNTNFGQDSNKEEYYKIFLNSVTTLLCTLIYKLETTYDYNEYNDIQKFDKIITLYKEEITHHTLPSLTNIEDLKIELLKNYNYIYDTSIKTDNYLILIDDFIKNSDFNRSNMNILHSLILFSSDIQDSKLIKILKILISLEKFNNDYHEFYKLNVCDVIINKFTQKQIQIIDKELIENIIEYIEKNKIASHLMSIYSKLYLSLSLYYSYYEDDSSIEKSKLYYFNYLSINGKELLENEFAVLNKNILLNHGERYISDLKLENVVISNAKCIEIGQKRLNKFFAQNEINLKYNINQKLSNIITQIFTEDGLNNNLLNEYIENFISRDIFHGLAFSTIVGLCEEETELMDLGYERLEIPLIKGYKLKIAYSIVYKHIFENIFEKNKEYIKQNIINLIISYIKSIPIYIDHVTKLYNIDKLRTELLKKDKKEFILVEIYINNMLELNNKYGYKKVNIFFKNYTEKIKSFVNPYRFYGPKIAFTLNKEDDYKFLINKIKELKMDHNDTIINPELTISVSWGDKDNILEKSSYAINLAQSKEDKYYEFK